MTEQELAALVEEATKRSGMVWIEYDGSQRARPAWHVWHEGSAYVVAGGGEQPLPDLGHAEQARVTVRSKDNQARLVAWTATVSTVPPDSAEWEPVARALWAERLNGTDVDSTLNRWAAESVITKLTPAGEVVERPGNQPADDHRAAPAPSPATTRDRLPWVVHRRPTRSPRL